MTAEQDIERLREQCEAIGFDLGRDESSLVERMKLLAEHSKAFDDASRMASYAHRVFRYYDIHKASEAFGTVERQTVVLACLFSDIGKSGPADADADGRRLVVEAFAVENVQDPSQTVASFFKTYFANDADERIARFCALGLDPSMSVRQFWNLHSHWTLAIAEAAGLPPEAVAAAACHHLLEDINPRGIVGGDDRFTCSFGENHAFDRAEKLVILLDKYDAVRRRGRLTHDRAIAWLRARIASSARFRDDGQFNALLDDLNTILATTPECEDSSKGR